MFSFLCQKNTNCYEIFNERCDTVGIIADFVFWSKDMESEFSSFQSDPLLIRTRQHIQNPFLHISLSRFFGKSDGDLHTVTFMLDHRSFFFLSCVFVSVLSIIFPSFYYIVFQSHNNELIKLAASLSEKLFQGSQFFRYTIFISS